MSNGMLRPRARPAETLLPLYVDLDGTLVATDLLHESALQLLKADPAALLRLPRWLAQGKAVLKREIASRVDLDIAHLPYRPEVLALIREARAQGRRVVLATAGDARYAQQVADVLGLFDGVLASDGTRNLSGEAKARAIAEHAGGPFAYAGDRTVDLPVWRRARQAVVVSASDALARGAATMAPQVQRVRTQRPGPRDVLHGIRLHQWLKNLLVGLPAVPLLHEAGGLALLAPLLLAMLCFGLMASAIYVLNDLLDLEADRRHPRKRLRPFASGRIPIPAALALSGALFGASLALSLAALPAAFTGWLLAYLALTSAYSLRLKRRAMVDVCTLAGLYTLRIIAGAAALQVPLSLWILSFSMFLFLSLALAKRYVEIAQTTSADARSLGARGYLFSDQMLVLAAGLASGQTAVLVLSLYLNDPLVAQRYAQPQWLWLLGPMLLFWILRVWLKASRGNLHDDPVVFAARDRVSLGLAGAMAVLVALSV